MQHTLRKLYFKTLRKVYPKTLRKFYSKTLRKRVPQKKKRLRSRQAVVKKPTILAAKNKHKVRLKAKLVRFLITRIRRRRYSRRLRFRYKPLNKKGKSAVPTRLFMNTMGKKMAPLYGSLNRKNAKTVPIRQSLNKRGTKTAPIRVTRSKYGINLTSRPIRHKLMLNSNILCTPFKLFRKSKLFKCYVYRRSYRLSLTKQSVTTQLLTQTTNNISNTQLFSNLLKRSVFVPTYFSKKFTRQTKIYTTHGSPFISYKDGLARTKKFSFKGKFIENSFLIKKKFYSFLRTNEYKKQIFNSRKKFLVSKVLKLLNTYSSKFNSLNFFTTSNMRFLQKNQRIENEPYVTSPGDRIHSLHSKLKVANPSITYRELHMQRVRFKPGYQRLWRNFRLALAELVNFRYIYQKQLTRYLIKFSRKLTQNYYSFSENDVMRVIIYTRLIPDEATFNLFHNNNLIFLNNKPLNNGKSFIYKNDFLQLEITN